MTQQLNRIPDFGQALVAKGVTNSAWFRYWSGLFSGAPTGNISVVTVSSSPFTYKAPVGGTVIIQGGTVTQVQFSRDGASFYIAGQTNGLFPMSQGDLLVVTFSVPPNMTFVPR